MNSEFKTPLTVTQLTEMVKLLVEENFGTIPFPITGEISNYKGANSSGHYYFVLKDKNSLISAVIFKGAARSINFRFEEGMSVVARGRVSLYPPQGKYQFVIEEMLPTGIGDLYRQFELLKTELGNKGYFDETRKKKLPYIPDSIGVITSPTGAVVKDIINGIKRRAPHTKIKIFPVKVQGMEAAKEIKETFEFLAAHSYFDLDLIILGRGGGSIEDLWPFNEKMVADAIYNCHIPVISAVGHMTDYTISDFVADVRAATPSNAAEIATRQTVEVKKQLSFLTETMTTSLLTKISRHRQKLNSIYSRKIFQDPLSAINFRYQLLDMKIKQLEYNLKKILISNKNEVLFLFSKFNKKALKAEISKRRETLDHLRENLLTSQLNIKNRKKLEAENLFKRITALNPYEVLKRGYCLLMDENNNLRRRVETVETNETLNLKLSDGNLSIQVLNKTKVSD